MKPFQNTTLTTTWSFDRMNTMVGVDEAGRGPVLGPLVVGICAVPTDDVRLLVEQGVRDSKDLSSKKRAEIERWFWNHATSAGWYGATVVITPERIDEALQDRGLNWLEVEAFQTAIGNLPKKESAEIITDACDVDANRFTHRIATGLSGWPWHNSTLVSEHKADEMYPVVAMASILAKEERDRAMVQMSELHGFNVGSGYPSDPTTKAALHRLVLQNGIDEQVRWEWATTKRFWKQNRRGDVPVRGRKSSVQQRLFHEDESRIS